MQGHKNVTSLVTLLLVDKRIDVNRQDEMGVTPFSEACRTGEVGLVELLLADMRVDINKPTDCQATPLSEASMFHLDVVQVLLASGGKLTPRPGSLKTVDLTAT